MLMNVSGRQYELLVNALLDAFPTQIGLAQMLEFRLEKNLNAIATGDNLYDDGGQFI